MGKSLGLHGCISVSAVRLMATRMDVSHASTETASRLIHSIKQRQCSTITNIEEGDEAKEDGL